MEPAVLSIFTGNFIDEPVSAIALPEKKAAI